MKADELETAVKDTLAKKAPKAVLAAVSGGVDSMVMLWLLNRFSSELSYTLHVITVNHNIRPKEESAGDAELVAEFCRELGVPCTIAELARNEVAETALKRKAGTEEAARFLRYQAFERCAGNCGADIVCVAHNRNDRLETILERFFQGARAASASGMKQSRGMFFRPLFDVTRRDIESYAACNHIPFRTDATNADNRYLRNRMRNELMPLLDTLLPGWDTAVLHGAEKNMMIASSLEKHAASVKWNRAASALPDNAACSVCDDGMNVLSASRADFKALEIAERIEALYNGLYLLETDRRVPFDVLKTASESMCRTEGAGISIDFTDDFIILSKDCDTEIDGFCCAVKECGCYSMPWGEIIIRESKDRVGKNVFYAENIKNGAISGFFPLPVLIRSRQPSDRIRDKNGGHKDVSKLFSEWHIPDSYEALLPVFDAGEVLGVWGGVFAYPDYFTALPEDRL